MKITQETVDTIIQRAQNSDFGLAEEPKNSMSVDMYAQKNFSTLAQILVGGFMQKYALISIFQAGLEHAYNEGRTHERERSSQ